MSMPSLPPDVTILQLVMGRWVSQCLSVAAKLAIADLLAAGPLPTADLAAKTSTDSGALYRILRALASVGVFTESAPGTFSNTPISDVLRTDAPNSMRNIAMMVNDPWQFDNWAQLGECVRTGKCAPEIRGIDLFAQIGGNPDALGVFQ